MDKQIIIDGKKITKEDFIDYFSIELTNRNVDERKEIGNKYFEIILSKEQECEELKYKLNCCFCNPYVELNDTEKQRKCVEVTECFRRQHDKLKAENKHLNDLLNQALKDYEKARETLTEIKEIAEEKANVNDWLALEILQKISEVEDERKR